MCDSEPLDAGINTLAVSVPSGIEQVESTYSRFRVSESGGLTYAGSVSNGEVEDYMVDVVRLMEGDASRDFRVNIIDAMIIAQYTVGIQELTQAQLECADTNDDGVVNIVDAMHLAQYTVDPTGSAGVLLGPLWVEATDPLTDAPA